MTQRFTPDPPEATLGWFTALSGFRNRRFLGFLLLGIAAGAPLASTWEWMAGQPAAGSFGDSVYYLTGFLTMVVVARLVLGPWLDMGPPLGFSRLGRRRGWTLLLILLAIPLQILIGLSTPGVAPLAGLFLAIIGGALLATIDAWRAESAEPRAQGILAAGQYIGAIAPALAVNFGTVLLGAGAATVSAVCGTVALIVGGAALPVIGRRTLSDTKPDPVAFPPVQAFLARQPNLSGLGRAVTARLHGACLCPISVWFARLGPVAPAILVFLVLDGLAQNGGSEILTPLLADGTFSMDRMAIVASIRALEPLVQFIGAIVAAVVVARLSARRALPWAVAATLLIHILTLAAIPALPTLGVYVGMRIVEAFLQGFGFVIWVAWLATVVVRPFTGWHLTILALLVGGLDQIVNPAPLAVSTLGPSGAAILFAILAVLALALALWLARRGPAAALEAWPEATEPEAGATDR